MKPIWTVDGIFRIGYPSEFVLALITGLPSSERVTHRMAIIQAQAYADDSGKEPPFFIFSGFVASAAAWAVFSDEWQNALDNARPRKISYLKTRDAYALRNQFLGFSESERDALIYSLWKIIDKHAQYGISVIIDANRYNSTFKGKIAKTLDSPYFILSRTFVDTVIQAERERGLSRTVDFIFDRQGPEEEQVAVYWEYFLKLQMPRWYRKRLGVSPIWRDEQQFRPLQAADMLAWTTRRMALEELQGNSIFNQSDLMTKLKSYLYELSIPLYIPNSSMERTGKYVKDKMVELGLEYETPRMRSEIRKVRAKLSKNPLL